VTSREAEKWAFLAKKAPEPHGDSTERLWHLPTEGRREKGTDHSDGWGDEANGWAVISYSGLD